MALSGDGLSAGDGLGLGKTTGAVPCVGPGNEPGPALVSVVKNATCNCI